MRIKRLLSLVLVVVMIVATVLSGCSVKEESVEKPEGIIKESNEINSISRVITDLTGKEIEIPYAKDINKVIIVAPPLVATYASVVKDTDKLVGVHPTSFKIANKDILNLVVPNWQNINTSFLSGFTSNTEEVLKMNPDIILVYGESQKKGLENVDIPVVDFYLDNPDNEEWSVRIDELMREIFQIEGNNTLEKEWEEAKKITAEALSKIKEADRKTAIMIRSYTQDSFSVRGANYYGDDWLVKTGLINAAGNMQGDDVQISMEQFYQWNPDIVYDFVGQDAEKYLQNNIESRDWSQIKAFMNKEIYDMPQGMFNWGAPNVDSPLTLIWMTMKNYPGIISEEFFNSYMKEYYMRQYGIELSDNIMNEILDPTK